VARAHTRGVLDRLVEHSEGGILHRKLGPVHKIGTLHLSHTLLRINTWTDRRPPAPFNSQWTPDHPTSVLTIPNAHTACVYAALFSPSQPATIASCSTDGFLKVWDTRQPAPTPTASIAAHPTEVLSLDWNKYNPTLIATGSVDRSIRVHDLRMAGAAPVALPGVSPPKPATVASLIGHEYAVRRVAWSPHSASLLASGSYDMSARVWDVQAAGQAPGGMAVFGSGGMGGRVVGVHGAHTEFVTGVAWSLYERGLVASCGWDQVVDLWTV